MSQAIAKTSKTLRSFNHLYHHHHHHYKVCNQTLRSSYLSSPSSSISLIKPFSFVENYNTLGYNTLGYDTINKSLYFSETKPQFNQNPSRVYDQTYNSNVNLYNQNYQENRNDSYAHPEDEGRLRGTIEDLDALCKERKLKEAVEVLGLLQQNNVSVDLNRFLLLMNECGETQALEEGKKVHEYLVRSISHIDVWICNKILEMYAKCGSMEDAYKVFDKMSKRNVTSWDTMITWLAKNGHGEDAINMFTEFKKIGLKPDSQMFFGVFTACSVVGDMKEGLLHFDSMSKSYNIIPSMDHYKSVVDMLGGAGYLNEALQFIEKMPMEPSVVIWETLMNNCHVYGDTELGDRCLELIELLDPTRLNEQTKAGLIPIKASDIAKEKEKKRLSSLNPLEHKTKSYEYRAGDTSHPEHPKLYHQLRCLKQPMIEVGYVPETRFVLHDVDQESKEEALLSHSERLALSQALMTSPARSTIRIIKNLRVCGDCHNALKIISKIVGRLIVARDAKRFHHFENGVCSCGDYW
ncbi:pentatricopeptide repeat-containing protein At4g32450, mitochondrial-like [Rutidosis leptorrhynchoides]|uniref:pentatricopeptide repeat-containing protein At4g32450, mitochondrial-like n=1 Tax=Rutidosis leptorrhynchoides TaxID=125765 RepID=UPI003A98ED38